MPEDRAYEKLLSEYICGPRVVSGDNVDNGKILATAQGHPTTAALASDTVAPKRSARWTERGVPRVSSDITGGGSFNDSDRQADTGLLKEIFVAYCSFGVFTVAFGYELNHL